ncbi:hypothetical protein [Lysobacter solisilvae (ex Woo and Kim 2020)]|uniref:Nuclear transport factor 2 family protein n=1 Tax=Agrilutibacter terrestris TaxID=2865112 RepID=A0A7H0FVW0_9GAMM|nr:hypothetical protein [Lysobacter terrestris]QNP40176.1 hypothetical protein H8B22_11855 [Lysobacter terrestris]
MSEFYRRALHPTKQEIAAPRFSPVLPLLGQELAKALTAFVAYERACARITPPDMKPHMIDQDIFIQIPDGAQELLTTSQQLYGDVARVSATLRYDTLQWTDTVLLANRHGNWVILNIQWQDGWSLTKRLTEFAGHRCAP